MNKNLVKDVVQFCAWLKPALEGNGVNRIMTDDYSYVLHAIGGEMNRLASMKYMKIAREDYEKWARHN